MTKNKIIKILNTYLEDKKYLFYDQGMYPKWITKNELIELVAADLLNNSYNEEPITEVTYCYYEPDKKINS